MGLFQEMRVIFRLAFPTMIRCYFSNIAGGATLGLVGHYDPSQLHIASAAFGKMYSNVTGLSIGVGIALGINTFASQNHGRGASTENGVVLWKCLQAYMLAALFSIAAVLLSVPILTLLQQPLELLWPSQKFSLIQLGGMPAKWLFEALNNILCAQCLVTAGMWCDSVTSVLNLILAYCFLRCGSGFLGSAWAFVVSQWVCLALLIIYIRHGRLQRTVWKVPDQVSSLGRVSLSRYMSATLPSAFSVWSEWWAAEVLAILAGMLPGRSTASVGANGILLNTIAVFYMTFVGVQAASTTRIGNLVGAQDAQRIPIAIASAVLLAVSLSCACSAALQVFGPNILELWTTDLAIIEEATRANLGLVLCMPPYSVMMCLLGVLRGAGLQMRGAVAVFVSFYIFGLPLGAYLGLRAGWGLLGVWCGNVTGLCLSAMIMAVQVCFIRWENVIDEMQTEALREHMAELIVASDKK